MIVKSFKYNGLDFEYSLIRKNVKNINMRVDRNKRVSVSVNSYISDKEVHEFLKSKSSWISKTFAKLSEVEYKRKLMRETNKCAYLGKLYDKSDFLHNNKVLDKNLDAWYFKQAKAYLDKKVRELYMRFARYDIEFPKVTIRKMKTRWGSCNKRLKKINLNSELIKQLPEAIEYVVVHELAHLIYDNHSPNYYKLLNEIMPDYKERKEELQTHYI